MTTTVINFKDKAIETKDLPEAIQQTVMFYDAAIEARKKFEIELVIATAASNQLLAAMSTQIEQWEKEEAEKLIADAAGKEPDTDVSDAEVVELV